MRCLVECPRGDYLDSSKSKRRRGEFLVMADSDWLWQVGNLPFARMSRERKRENILGKRSST